MKLSIFTILLSTLVGGTALAGETAVFPVNVTNVAPGEGEAIGVLFSQAYADASGAQVLSPSATRTIVESASSPVAAARALAVDEYIVIDAVRLTTKIKLSAARFDNTGKLIHRAEMTALSLDDVENVADRLAAALYHRQSPEQTRTLDTITETEGEEPNKLFSDKVFGPKLQFTVMLASGAKIDPTLSALFDMRFEGESYFLEFGIGIMVPTNAWQSGNQLIRYYGGVISELGANYYFINDDISVYAGGGILPRLMGGTNMDVGVQLAVYAQGGAMFFRSSSTRLYTDFRVAQNLLPFQSRSWSSTVVREYFPTELTLSVGIGW